MAIGIQDRFQNPLVHTDAVVAVWSVQHGHIVLVCGDSKQPCFITIDPHTWTQLVKTVNKVIKDKQPKGI